MPDDQRTHYVDEVRHGEPTPTVTEGDLRATGVPGLTVADVEFARALAAEFAKENPSEFATLSLITVRREAAVAVAQARAEAERQKRERAEAVVEAAREHINAEAAPLGNDSAQRHERIYRARQRLMWTLREHDAAPTSRG